MSKPFNPPRKPEPAQAQHSPLPWRITPNHAGGCCIVAKRPKNWKSTPQHPDYIVTQCNLYVCVPNEEQAQNAAFIVRACNNAQRLADALKLLMPQTERLAYHAFSEEVPEWLARNNAMNCAKRAHAQWENK